MSGGGVTREALCGASFILGAAPLDSPSDQGLFPFPVGQVGQLESLAGLRVLTRIVQMATRQVLVSFFL